MHRFITLVFAFATVAVCYGTVYSADSFVGSTCIGTHPWYPNVTKLYEMAQASGIRVLREDISNSALSTSLGMKSMIAIPTYQSNVVDQPSLQDWFINVAKAQILSDNLSVDSFEGPNEPNGFWPMFGYKYNGQGYPDGVLPMLRDIWDIAKNDSVLSQYPIIGASWSQAGPCPFMNGELAPYVDWGDMHPYPTSNYFSAPQSYAGADNYFGYTNDPINTIGAGYAPDPYVWGQYYPAYDPKPMAFSETGYATMGGGITETVHGKYIPRLYLENFRLGIQRTCIYELYDEGTDPTNNEANFGIIRNDYSLKPAYLVLQDLLNMLAEPNANFTPDDIDMTVEVSPVGDYTWIDFVHNLLLQKQSGEYYVVLWHEIALMNIHDSPATNLPTPPDMPTVISFSGKTISNATEYTWDDNGIISSQPSTLNGNSNISTVARPQVRLIQISFD